jgi:hypothetical protein
MSPAKDDYLIVGTNLAALSLVGNLLVYFVPAVAIMVTAYVFPELVGPGRTVGYP